MKINELGWLSVYEKLNKLDRVGSYFTVKNGIKVRKELLFNKEVDKNYKPFVLGKDIRKFKVKFEKDCFIHYLPENEKLYTNQAFRTKETFECPKLLVRQILGDRIIVAYDDEFIYADQTTYLILGKPENLLALLCLLSSKLLYFYFQNTFSDGKDIFPKVKGSQILEMPLPEDFEKMSLQFENLAKCMIENLRNLETEATRLPKLLKSKHPQLELTKKLNDWHTGTYADFLKEIKRQKLSWGLREEAEWMEFFGQEQAAVQSVQADIRRLDGEIDRLVYGLYGLSAEEILVVEGAG